MEIKNEVLEVHEHTKEVPVFASNCFLPEAESCSKTPGLSACLQHIKMTHPWLHDCLDFSRFTSSEWQKIYKNIDTVSAGGFNHGETGKEYGRLQRSDSRYYLSRMTGYHQLFFNLNARRQLGVNDILVDGLSGNGTLARNIKTFPTKQKPFKIICHDISQQLVVEALKNGHAAIRGLIAKSPLKSGIASAAIAAYGTHHIPVSERAKYFEGIHRILGANSPFLFQDFHEKSVTGRWYSEIIDRYRPEGHCYTHFTEASLSKLFKDHFTDIEVKSIYDPFCIPANDNQTDKELHMDFFSYLIKLFNLKKLLPNGVTYKTLHSYQNRQYWEDVSNILTPYFEFLDRDLDKLESIPVIMGNQEKISVPVLGKLSIVKINNQRFLVAPRKALLGIGMKK